MILKDKNIELITNLEENIGEVEFDYDRISEVVLNLLNNAIKFTEKGTITVSSKKSNDQIIISVADTGLGMKKDDISKLFQSFTQLKTKTSEKGTGLGLAICRKIIDLHKGKIWVESEEGKGSTFYFSFPINKS